VTNKYTKVYKYLIVVFLFGIFTLIYNPGLYGHGIFSRPLKRGYRNHNWLDDVPENLSYQKWCKDTFINGDFVYEAYRQIAFGVKYVQEPPQNDFWQTPLETLHRCAGDCEDAILLFNNNLPRQYSNGKILWGVMEDLNKGIEFAHVWFELIDRKGHLYIVEPFTENWDGIIPIELLKTGKIKKKILGIPGRLISELLNNRIEMNSIRRDVTKNEATYDQNRNRLIENIFGKLSRVSRRYINQKRLITRKKN